MTFKSIMTLTMVLPDLRNRTCLVTACAVAIALHEPDFLPVPIKAPIAAVHRPNKAIDAGTILPINMLSCRATTRVLQHMLLCFGRSDAVNRLRPGFSRRATDSRQPAKGQALT